MYTTFIYQLHFSNTEKSQIILGFIIHINPHSFSYLGRSVMSKHGVPKGCSEPSSWLFPQSHSVTHVFHFTSLKILFLFARISKFPCYSLIILIHVRTDTVVLYLVWICSQMGGLFWSFLTLLFAPLGMQVTL
jgi:hypothetical protein